MDEAFRTLTESTAESLKNSVLGSQDDAVSHEPVVEVLWHYDLGMIGAQWYPSVQAEDARVAVGRHSPEFITQADDRWCPHATRRALEDPCISRHHFELRWRQGDAVFELRATSRAKLEVSLRRPDALETRTPLEARWTEVAPGIATVLKIKGQLRKT